MNNNNKVLVVEDDRKTADLIRLYLERDGYRVFISHDGRQALDLVRYKEPDLIVLDLMLPKVSGLDICRIVRSETEIPIIMLTARTTEEDKLLGLDLGADDYITKPFSPRELVARVRAVLRRSGAKQKEIQRKLEIGNMLLDFMGHEVRIGGNPVQLTPKEFRILSILAKQRGRAFTRLELVEEAFGFDYEGFKRTIDVHVMNLRKKIEPDPSFPTFIRTVYGVGYKFGEPVDAA